MAGKIDLLGFLDLLSGASFAAGIAVLVVVAARLILKKAPKRWSYIMWAVVFFRCLCPFAAESSVSIFNALNFAGTALTSETAEADGTASSPDVFVSEPAPVTDGGYIPYAPSETFQPPASEEYSVNTESVRSDSYEPVPNDIQNVYNSQNIQNVDEKQSEQTEYPIAENGTDSRTVFIIVWLCGVGAMALYGIVSAARLAARVKTAVRTENGIYESDRISTAFAAGLLRPKIYIPCGIPEDERRLIVMHERVHIRRRDYLFKLLAFAGLSLHWFNPLIWAAFALMTRDMEMSCDEAVLRECGGSGRILYAEALLRVSVRGFGGAAVVGFGETGIKKRVKNVLNYKKPGKLAAVAAAAVMLASCTMAGTDAVTDNADTANGADAAAAHSGTMLEKGTTELSGSGGERFFFAYAEKLGETAFWKMFPPSKNEEMPALVLPNGSRGGVGFYEGDKPKLAVSSEFQGYNGSASCGAPELTIGLDPEETEEITVKGLKKIYKDELAFIEVDMDIRLKENAEPPQEFLEMSRGEFSSDFKDGVCSIKAEIEVRESYSSSDGTEYDLYGYGFILCGFDNVPIYVSDGLEVVGRVDSSAIGTETPVSESSADIAVSREYEFDTEKYIDGLIYKDQWQVRNELDFLSDEQYDVFIRAWLFIDMIEPLNEISIRTTSEIPKHYLDKNGEVCASYYDREKNEYAQYEYVSTYQSFYKYLQSVFTQDAVDKIMSDKRFLTVGDELYFSFGEAGGAIDFKGGEYRLVEKNDDEVAFEYVARHSTGKEEWTVTHPIRLVRTADGWHSELFEHLRCERRPEVYEQLRGERLSEQERSSQEEELQWKNIFSNTPDEQELRLQEELRRLREEEERQRRQIEESANAEKFSYPFSRFPVSAADLGEYGANERHVLFAVPKGTEVLAAEDGTVKSAKKEFNSGCGLCMEISHDDEMSTFYAHLDEFAVKVGDKVKKGDVIAYSGSSGYTEGDALLFEIRRDGIAEDPRDYYSFSEDGYRRALEDIGKNYEGGGIQGIYYEDGTPLYEKEQETIELNGETYYLIFTEEQLRAIAAGVYGMDKNFLQKSTIQLSDKEWMPIGTKEAPFTGSYNGNGFEIIGLTITDPNATRIGMFGWTENADIYNITLRDYDIESAGGNAKRISVAPVVPVVTNGTRCYDNHVYPAESPESASVLVKPCPQEVKISSLYGKDNENSVFNKGINYMAAKGTEVYAAADGKVLVSEDRNNGYGITVIIDHGGELATLYAHLDEALVGKGDEVKAGGLIGYSGHTGFAYGDTLHFEVRENGQHVDPMNYFKI